MGYVAYIFRLEVQMEGREVCSSKHRQPSTRLHVVIIHTTRVLIFVVETPDLSLGPYYSRCEYDKILNFKGREYEWYAIVGR
jgi:hypothetical protein